MCMCMVILVWAALQAPAPHGGAIAGRRRSIGAPGPELKQAPSNLMGRQADPDHSCATLLRVTHLECLPSSSLAGGGAGAGAAEPRERAASSN